MIIHDTDALGRPLEQGSRDWWALRLGRITVSRLPRILTPSRLDYSKGAHAFAAELLAERILGRPLDDSDAASMWTARGTDLEAEARRWYEFYRDVEVRQVGFITTDGGQIGGSPDGLVGEDGIVEIKCRSARMHARCVFAGDEIADRLQTQGYLWLTDRKWVDEVAYNPDLPKKIVRSHQIPEVQEAITKALDQFMTDMQRAEERLEALGDVIEESDELVLQLIQSIEAKS